MKHLTLIIRHYRIARQYTNPLTALRISFAFARVAA